MVPIIVVAGEENDFLYNSTYCINKDFFCTTLI